MVATLGSLELQDACAVSSLLAPPILLKSFNDLTIPTEMAGAPSIDKPEGVAVGVGVLVGVGWGVEVGNG
jgi:hypothetical protein